MSTEYEVPRQVLEVRRQQVIDTMGHLAEERVRLDDAYEYNVSRLIAIDGLIKLEEAARLDAGI